MGSATGILVEPGVHVVDLVATWCSSEPLRKKNVGYNEPLRKATMTNNTALLTELHEANTLLDAAQILINNTPTPWYRPCGREIWSACR